MVYPAIAEQYSSSTLQVNSIIHPSYIFKLPCLSTTPIPHPTLNVSLSSRFHMTGVSPCSLRVVFRCSRVRPTRLSCTTGRHVRIPSTTVLVVSRTTKLLGKRRSLSKDRSLPVDHIHGHNEDCGNTEQDGRGVGDVFSFGTNIYNLSVNLQTIVPCKHEETYSQRTEWLAV